MISLIRLPTIANVGESWSEIKNTIHKATYATLGITNHGKRFINRDTWLWNDDVQMKVCESKCLYHKFFDAEMREAKKAIAITRAVHYKDLYDKLDTWDAEKDLYLYIEKKS